MIVVDNVSKYYGAHRAVSELSFEIREGECVGFLGLNGAGKSTTLRLLSCLLLPTSGRIRVRDLDVVADPHEIRRFIGYLPDQPPLYGEMTVREYLSFAGRLRGLSGEELDKRSKHVIGLCDLGGVSGTTIAALSHGFRQRVGIAQAVLHNPALLILDEPIQGLDPVQIVEMRNMIGALRGEHTILLSTHILTEIEQTCDRILMMHEGRITAQGTEEELADRMSAGRKLEIEVLGDTDKLERALASVAQASDVQMQAQPEGTLRATMRIDEDDVAHVSRAVVTAGLDLVQMRMLSSGLEEVFLRLSRGERSKQAEQEPPAAPQREGAS